MSKEFFPLRPSSRPTTYAHEDTAPQFVGLLKVGYTTVEAQSRVAAASDPSPRQATLPDHPWQNRNRTSQRAQVFDDPQISAISKCFILGRIE